MHKDETALHNRERASLRLCKNIFWVTVMFDWYFEPVCVCERSRCCFEPAPLSWAVKEAQMESLATTCTYMMAPLPLLIRYMIEQQVSATLTSCISRI